MADRGRMRGEIFKGGADRTAMIFGFLFILMSVIASLFLMVNVPLLKD